MTKSQTDHAEINGARRWYLKSILMNGGAALAALVPASTLYGGSPKEQPEREATERAARGMPTPKIRDVSIVEVGAGGVHDVTVVKVLTDQAGLYGYGCASISMPGGRSKLVRAAIEEYLKPFVIGREADRIEQIWRLCFYSSYYKNDAVQNCAIGGLCDALWDIKGRQAGLPVYQLVGGKCREAAAVYVNVEMGNKAPDVELVENARKLTAKGYRTLRVAMGRRYGTIQNLHGQTKFEDGSVVFDRDMEMRKVLTAFESFRKHMPEQIDLCVDVHSLLDPPRAVRFGQDLERFRLFFCEDLFATEDQAYYQNVRRLCTTPLAMGELWSNPHEWRPLIESRSIDYIRHHVSHVGGFTAARKIANVAEDYGIQFAWHGGPNSPIGHMTNLTLDLTHSNFGIHEHFEYPALTQDVFQGGLEVKDGYAYIKERPGWGIEVDEKLAAKHPIRRESPNEVRTRDGSVIPGTG